MKISRKHARSLPLRDTGIFYAWKFREINPDDVDTMNIVGFPKNGLFVMYTPSGIVAFFFDKQFWKKKIHIVSWVRSHSILHYEVEESKGSYVPPLTDISWINEEEILAVSMDYDNVDQLGGQDLLHTLSDYLSGAVSVNVYDFNGSEGMSEKMLRNALYFLGLDLNVA